MARWSTTHRNQGRHSTSTRSPPPTSALARRRGSRPRGAGRRAVRATQATAHGRAGEEIAAGRARDEPYEESREWLDPRALSIALDELPPAERTVVVDSGAFMGYSSMYLAVPDAQGFVFPQAFQCVGLGLGNAIGAAWRARPADGRRTG